MKKRGGGGKFYPVLIRGGGGDAKCFGPVIFQSCSYPLPLINDRSLIFLKLALKGWTRS